MYLYVILTNRRNPEHCLYLLDPNEVVVLPSGAPSVRPREERGWSHRRGASAIATNVLQARMMAEHVLWVEAVGNDV